MSKSSYPAEADLVARLTAADIDPTLLSLLQDFGATESAILAAIAEWESATDWKPYLAGSVTSRTFDAPVTISGGVATSGMRLVLSPALLTLSSVRAAGRTLAQGVDFIPAPQNAANEGRPYQWIQFLTPPPCGASGPGSIVVTGTWGAVAAIPDDVWNAIVQLAEHAISPELSLAISEGMLERKIGDSIKKFAGTGSAGPLDLQTRLWMAGFQRCVTREKRVVY